MSGCGVWCVPSHNIQNITKYAAPNKEISWDRAGMLCSNPALGYLLNDDWASDYMITNMKEEDTSHDRNDAHFPR